MEHRMLRLSKNIYEELTLLYNQKQRYSHSTFSKFAHTIMQNGIKALEIYEKFEMDRFKTMEAQIQQQYINVLDKTSTKKFKILDYIRLSLIQTGYESQLDKLFLITPYDCFDYPSIALKIEGLFNHECQTPTDRHIFTNMRNSIREKFYPE